MKRLTLNALSMALLSLLTPYLSAQENLSNQPIVDILEQLATDGEEQNWANEIEDFSDLSAQPLNLNSATREQLERFPFLSDIQIENIQAYIYIHGQMKTVHELQLVSEMDYQTIQSLLPFVCVRPVEEKETLPRLKQVIKHGKNEMSTRLDIPFYKREGYKRASKPYNLYLGPPAYHSLRYSFRYRDKIYAGLTAEKDAGEPFFAGHNKKGYDYYSFYFYLKNIRKLKTLAVGNYRLSFGQGLVISNDFLLGKTTTASTVYSRSNGIKKHSSTDEYNYQRGVAATYRIGKFDISGFYSHRSLDAIVGDDGRFTSIQSTGLHRTEREADRRSAVTLQLVGGNITYSSNYFKIGMTGIYYSFDTPYDPKRDEKGYTKYKMHGKAFNNLGIDYRLRWRRFVLAGEVALDKKQSIATVNTLSYSPAYRYRFMLVHRYYKYDYWGHYARSFSEGGSVQNENGWYFALEAAPFRYWKFFASADFFSFPWKKYLVDDSSQGTDVYLQATFTPSRKLTMYFRYRYKEKDKNYTDDQKKKTVRPLYHHRARYQLKYVPSERFAFRTTIDYNHIHPQKAKASQGYQISQSITHVFARIPFVIELQGSYFHTDDYASRNYAYEKGLLYTFYTPSFYGEGSRFSTHIRWNICKAFTAVCKYGLTAYFDRDEIGSGEDLIKGNKKSDLQIQLRIKF